MTEEQGTTEQTVPENNQTPETTPEQTTGQAQENIFDGIDSALFDENGFRQKEVASRLKENKEALEKKDKQILDLRKIISKGVGTPDTPDDYVYKPDKDLEKYYSGEGQTQQFVREAMTQINKTAYENGMSITQANAVKGLFNEFMKSVNLFENNSVEAKERRQAYREQILGKDADQITEKLSKTIQNNNNFSENEKASLLRQISSDPFGACAIGKLSQLAFGTMGDIPVREYVQNGTLASDYQLAKEYMDEKTSDHRREEIIRQRIEAGRTNPLPIGEI